MQRQDQIAMTEAAKQPQAENTPDSTGSGEDIEEIQTTDEPEAETLTSLEEIKETDTADPKHVGFDWLALGLVILIAAFFSLTARFNSQPAPSYVPAAVLSATGCGLLITALRKLRTLQGIGLFEAALGGLFLALFQFAIALTYPSVFATLFSQPTVGHPFLLTWGLIGFFAVVMSLAGASLGHLAFAPLRALPVKNARPVEPDEEDGDDNADEFESEDEAKEQVEQEQEDEDSEQPTELDSEDSEQSTETDDHDDDFQNAATVARPRRPLLNYVVTIVLIGLLPMMIGYVFAAAYDYIMGLLNANQISPALYPTLSLLSGILPWRLPAPINLSSANGSFIIFTLLWRIPDSFLGNPQVFDVQALEPLLFNSAALTFFLITMYGREADETSPKAAPWGIFLALEALLGLIIILPPALWIHRGLEGVLQMQSLVVQLPSIQLLNPLMLTLNLVTAPLFCLLAGIIIRRQYQLWTQPQKKTVDEVETVAEEPEVKD